MSEWLSIMQTDIVPPSREVYIKRLEKKIKEQDNLLKLHSKFKLRYINYLRQLNAALFAENKKLKKQLEKVGMTLEDWRVLRSKDDVVTLSTGAIKQLVDYISKPLPSCSEPTTKVNEDE